MPYLGAAHGFVGILYIMAEAILMNQGSIKLDKNFEAVFAASLDNMLKQQRPDGNIPCIEGEE